MSTFRVHHTKKGRESHSLVRITVPLFSVFPTRLPTGSGRYEVAPGVVLAKLDARESQRVQKATWGMPDPPEWRLELHDYKAAICEVRDPWSSEVTGFAISEEDRKEVKKDFALMACTLREPPAFAGVAFDKQNGDVWRRVGTVAMFGGSIARNTRLRFDRLVTWARLRENWPKDCGDDLLLALDFYYDSIVDARNGNYGKALVGAVIAFEIMLIGDLQNELRHRMSQRGALLVAFDDDARRVYNSLSESYKIRSKLFHRGREPQEQAVIWLQQYLMRAIPSMAKLATLVGSHDNAIRVLDDAAFHKAPELHRVLQSDKWWSFVDVPSITPPGGR